MQALDILLHWIHLLCVVVFIGAMFFATFLMMPTLKEFLEHKHRHRFIVNLLPRIRRVMWVVVPLLVATGASRAVILHLTHEGPPGTARLAVFGLKMLFAALPILIFALAPRILGAKSKEELCCDPDSPAPEAFGRVLTGLGEGLHYAAIAGGGAAVLCGVILAHMR